MAHRLKEARIAQVLDVLKVADSKLALDLSKSPSLKYNKAKNDIELHFGINGATSLGALEKIPDSEIRQQGKNSNLVLPLPKKSLISEVVNSIVTSPRAYYRDSPLLNDIKKQKILVEFSSPNIAKPFHMGHLRSTIIGNFISNLMTSLGHDVVKINYLGDWGTQFGLLNLGLQMRNVTDQDIASDPIKVLYESYVFANKQGETNPDMNVKARQIFKQMEDGDFAEKDRWEKIRQYTTEELRKTYLRLGVTFDEYQWESMFGAKDMGAIIQELEDKGILKTLPDGKRVVQLTEKRNCTLVKSDGSTLYLTRDVAAAKYRFARHSFDQLLYVVENGQADHFVALKHILKEMNLPWGESISHIKFGRIHGLSTRKGQAVFLKDILDEACERAKLRQENSQNTRVNIDQENSDILGLTAVVVNDLKQRRQKDYNFDWEKALQMQGDGGVRLQYTHCRLCTLEEKSDVQAAKECDSSLLLDPHACRLVAELGRFDEVLKDSYLELESCILVNYLFTLCHCISQSLKVMQVKNQPDDIASQRLMLFVAAKNVLGEAMRILGIEPLEKM